MDRIIEHQKEELELAKLSKRVDEGKGQEFSLKNGMLWFQDRLCVPNIFELKKEILKEAHDSTLMTHPGNTKMYQDLKRNHWWTGMKMEVAKYVARCLTCQKVKIEHQKPGGLVSPLPILVWKWEHITVDFIIGLQRTSKHHDAI